MQTLNQFKFQVGDTAMVMDVLSDTIKHIYKYRIYNDGKRLKPFYKKASRAQINQILELHRVDISLLVQTAFCNTAEPTAMEYTIDNKKTAAGT